MKRILFTQRTRSGKILRMEWGWLTEVYGIPVVLYRVDRKWWAVYESSTGVLITPPHEGTREDALRITREGIEAQARCQGESSPAAVLRKAIETVEQERNVRA